MFGTGFHGRHENYEHVGRCAWEGGSSSASHRLQYHTCLPCLIILTVRGLLPAGCAGGMVGGEVVNGLECDMCGVFPGCLVGKDVPGHLWYVWPDGGSASAEK